eukprot:GDKI01033181.1.p2 GENE.GDKI01033181.1~~GDKI01033181.1.p2  ORF type:complete len:114 (+),score=51.90 GDKI01033181.1:354-695(+)
MSVCVHHIGFCVCRDAAGAVVVYDSSHSGSFESVKFWVKELREKGPPNCSIAVAANKSDVPERQIDPNEAKAYCDGADMAFLECSAKTGDNVGRLFETLAAMIYQQMLKEPPR